MFSLDRSKGTKRPGSNIALAIALLCGTAMTAGVFAEPAHAQKKKKKKESKADYSRDFLKSYQAAAALLSAEPKDVAGATALLPDVLSKVQTADDKMVAGQLHVNIGVESDDMAMQKTGIDMMIDSGRLAPDQLGRHYYSSGQIAYQMDDSAGARARFQQALEAGYEADLQNVIASTYFEQDAHKEGIEYYRGVINAEIAAGRTPREDWILRAFSAAYNNDLAREAIEFAAMNTQYHPSETNWRNAIAVQRNYVDMQDDVLLDLMRLAYRTGIMQDDRDYADYIEAADPRKLPNEVKMLIDEAISKGIFNASDPFVSESRSTAAGLIKADRADLPSLERDARAASATALAASSAGDVFLNFGESAKAEEMYAIAATKSGADLNRVMTRMGIAQFDQGKFAAAAETFGKVGGSRKAVGNLWQSFAQGKAAPTAPAVEAPAEATT